MEGGSSRLPSEEVYAPFEEPNTCITGSGERPDCNQSVIQNVKSSLNLWPSIDQTLAPIIVKNYYNSCMMGESNLDYYDPCKFFYFWLGSQIRGKLPSGIPFGTSMSAIYMQLSSLSSKHKCKLFYYDNNDLEIFKHAKDLHDFEYNIKALEAGKKGNCNDYSSTYTNYNTNLTAAQTAYEWLCKKCGSLSGYTYCQEFDDKYRKNKLSTKYKNFSELTCTDASSKKVEAKKEESESEEDDDDYDEDNPLLNIEEIEVDGPLSTLPSRKDYYKLFDEGMSKCNGEDWSWPNQIKAVLEDDDKIKDHAVQISKALCHVYGEKGKDNQTRKLTEEYCDFFYFWVGKMFWSSTNKQTFKEIMEKIKVAVGRSETEHGCSFRFPIKGRNYFFHSKILFDYYENKDDMKTRLQQIGEDVASKCDDPYYKYFLQAHEAYNYMNQKCPSADKKSTNNEWCAKFKEIYGDCTNGGEDDGKSHCKVARTPLPSSEQCNSHSKPDTLDTTSSSTANDTNSVTPGVVAGSTLATVGLPAIGFFLYKYTSLFDGIKKSLFGGSNNTGGRSRGRRSTIGRQHFDDTSTDNDSSTMGDGSSTLGDDGSTTLGGGGESSTLSGSSTDISTIYEDGDGGRRRSSPPSRKPYNTQENRNIRYQNI
ncbi:KIR protein [Plasmodium knowlesi strain H]|uniref:KIR protein n=3 Tax=Plasmodium knowlesi TaxID=5850 RepID=A0A5K1UTP4_PLAKH|nr:KIR protein [Plasmodium knowlesi strain H]OTN64114.1 KIR protein [Plasmodium knowlesi]CAA9991295.1 KIR protein [Plasmodium knowlesi strain H]SBO26393.1 KIR protein [Plasmodium knowlesi strain H]SBO28998.1 KIR protein [Plasmodium knowlesi strain H]VVS80769.1 KIR protein [Plasmodium knowlesi strain H]|eukprot:XP_002262574.1 KIR protein [Plasmodium knowlesi strain H]